MARIFNIYFSYNNEMHNAVVSVRTTPFFTEYSLSSFNEELLGLLPGTKIISKSRDSFIFQNATPDNSNELMEEIIRAVAEHLQATKA
jgi:2-keto-3-deoxy-galactonokinase